MNHVRTFVLLALITALFVAVGYAIGGQSGMIIAFLLAAMMNFFAYWNSDRMVLSMYTPEPAVTDSAKRHWDNNMQLIVRTVFEEDFVVGRTMQANFHTGAQSHVIYGRNEPALAHFHRSLREALGESEPAPPALASAG